MHSSVLSIQFDNGLPYERERVVNEACFFSAQCAESMLEFGKRLILIKENEPQGEFHHILKSRLNLAPRTAQLMMQAAIKYLSPKLRPTAQALSHLGKTKLFELMTEDDEILAELADGGTVANLTLDEIDRMSTRELKEALKKVKFDAKADYDALQKRNTDISKEKEEMGLKLNKYELKTIPLDERLEPLKVQITQTQAEVDTLFNEYRQHIEMMEKLQFEAMENDPNYDPEAPFQLPESLHNTLLILNGALVITLSQTKRMYKDLWDKFGDEIETAGGRFDQVMSDIRTSDM
ncbi:DUF3102 domain-containing protein [Limnobaculum zhutongyuii]|uniref:DUF3102 domain-containing protein n=2 Tax=Limnobaculum zhutongyuii TaxID=2498113 RepID=A0A411WR42_9GAMM|nr:DUF3102 domain-containing protein [Limnobaculum zhutongyuii]TQS86154.1 DUF3102 domain-containing protein [Limnobaculum zhutongyuii]